MPIFIIVLLIAIGFSGSAGADTLSSYQKTALRKALESAEENDWSEADEIVSRSGNKLGRKIIKWRWMLKEPDSFSFDEISSFILENQEWPMQKQLRVKAEVLLAKEKSLDKAASFFAGAPPETGEGMLAYAAALKDANPAKAAELAKEGFARADLRGDDLDFYQHWLSSFLTSEEYAKRVERLLCEEKIAEAQNYLNAIPENERRLAKARIAVIGGEHNAGSIIESLPASLQSNPALTFDRIKYREERSDDAGVRELIATMKSGGCAGDLVWPYRRSAAQKFLSMKNYRAAYNSVAHSGLKEGEDFARAEFMAGWISLRFLKDARTAYTHFYKLHKGVSYPVSLSRGAYWAALAAKKNGNSDIASTWLKEAAKYPTTYFGQLAANDLGERLSIKESTGEPSVEDVTAFMSRETVSAALMLIEADRTDLARLFIYEIQNQSKNPVTHKLAAGLGISEGRPELSVRGAKNALRNGVTLLKEGYPIPPELKFDGAEKPIVLGLIRQESEFDDKAISKSGAVGLMQIMPKTAAHISKKSGIPYRPDELMDRGYNSQLGAEYISEMLGNYSGNLTLALAAYNAGPGRVRDWLETYGDPRNGRLSELDWIEMIPFEETRNYVMRVSENMEVYKYILSSHSTHQQPDTQTLSTSADYPASNKR